MTELDILSSHKHDISDVKEIYPCRMFDFLFVISDYAFRHSQYISLSSFVHIRVALQSVYFLNRVKAHLELSYLFHREVILTLKDDVCELQLLFFEL